MPTASAVFDGQSFQEDMLRVLKENHVADAVEVLWVIKNHLDAKRKMFGTLIFNYHEGRLAGTEHVVKSRLTDPSKMPW